MIKLIKAGAALLLLINTTACSQASHNENPGTLSYIALQLPSGWGYSVYKDGKVLIRQEVVPAVAGAAAFASERDARAVAAEVVKKLNLGLSPRITVEELQRLGVKY